MNVIVKSALAGFVASIGFGPVSSFAQDASCTCTTPYQGAANSIGSIGRANGDVMVSQAAGYGPAKAGNALDFGSRIVVGAKGSGLRQCRWLQPGCAGEFKPRHFPCREQYLPEGCGLRADGCRR